MNRATKKNVSMIIFGFLLAMFIVYGNVGVFVPRINIPETAYWFLRYLVKLLVAMTVLMVVFRHKTAGMIGSGLMIVLLLITMVTYGGRFLKNNLWTYAAGMVFAGLVFASCLMSPKKPKALGITTGALGIVCFIASFILSMFSRRGQFVGLDNISQTLSQYGFQGMFAFLNQLIMSRTSTLLYRFPFSIGLNFWLLLSAIIASTGRKVDRETAMTPTEGIPASAEIVTHSIGTKSKVVAGVLAFFLGTTGAHRYYLGYKKQGVIQTLGFVSLVVGWCLYIPAMLDQNVGMMLFTCIFLLYGAGVGIWAFVDFIRILTGGLAPADGTSYTENRPAQVQVIQPTLNANANADAIEKLAKLHQQGILTDEEFQQKKTDLLAKM